MREGVSQSEEADLMIILMLLLLLLDYFFWRANYNNAILSLSSHI